MKLTSQMLESLEAAAADTHWGPFGGFRTGHLTDEWFDGFLDDLGVPACREVYAGKTLDSREEARQALQTIFTFMSQDEQLAMVVRAARAYRQWIGLDWLVGKPAVLSGE